MLSIRRGALEDLEAVAAIQKQCPEAAQWDVTEYAGYSVWVALQADVVAGFVVGRTLAAGESEILNLAVAPAFRRQGIARGLMQAWIREFPGEVFLEVRASNRTAQKFYNSLGFEELMKRPGYYTDPVETAIVMKFHSC